MSVSSYRWDNGAVINPIMEKPIMNSNYIFNKSNKKQSLKKLAALSLCALLIACAALSPVIIFAHNNHEHNPNGLAGSCTICAQLMAAQNTLKSICFALLCAAIIPGYLCAAVPILKPVVSRMGDTLVLQKVRLNN